MPELEQRFPGAAAVLRELYREVFRETITIPGSTITGAAIPVGGGYSPQGRSIPRSPPVATPVAMRSDGA